MSISKVDRLVRPLTVYRPVSDHIIRWFVSVIAAIGSERRRGTPPLNDYLRRDIGLSPVERDRDWWNIR